MTFLEDLEDLFPDVVSIRPLVSTSGTGVKNYGTAYTIKAQVTGKLQTTKTPQGIEVESNVQAILLGAPGVKRGDEVTLPARFDPVKPPILSVMHQTDELGALYEKILF